MFDTCANEWECLCKGCVSMWLGVLMCKCIQTGLSSDKFSYKLAMRSRANTYPLSIQCSGVKVWMGISEVAQDNRGRPLGCCFRKPRILSAEGEQSLTAHTPKRNCLTSGLHLTHKESTQLKTSRGAKMSVGRQKSIWIYLISFTKILIIIKKQTQTTPCWTFQLIFKTFLP